MTEINLTIPNWFLIVISLYFIVDATINLFSIYYEKKRIKLVADQIIKNLQKS